MFGERKFGFGYCVKILSNQNFLGEETKSSLILGMLVQNLILAHLL
jgi:hypothetical protein